MSRKTIGSLLVRLGMDPRDADQAIKKFERNLKDMSRRMESLGKTMTIGFTAPFIYGIGKAIKAFDEEAQAVKKLEVALGGTSKALLEQAAAIQKNTIYADDQVLTVQAWAAALGHSEDQILSMTTAATGLAAGLGIDLQQAMEMLHKTTTGSTGALGKLIPEIKAMSKEQLVAGEAVDLVRQKFEGFAEAAALTGTGPLKILKNSFGDLTEQIGQAALPIVIAFSAKLQELITWFTELDPKIKESIVGWGALVAAIGPMLYLLPQVIKLFAGLFSTTGLVIASIASLAAIGIYLTKNWEVFADSWAVIWWGIRKNVTDGVNATIAGINAMSAAIAKATGTAAFFINPIAGPSAAELEGNSQVNPFSKDDRRHSIWEANKKTAQTPGEFLQSIGTDVWGFLGGIGGQNIINGAMSNMPGMPSGGGVSGGGAASKPKSGSGFQFTDWADIRAMDAGIDASGSQMKVPEMGTFVSTYKEGFEAVADSANLMKDVISTAMGSIIGNLDEGGKSFGEYALNAIKSVGMVVRAKLMELAVEALFDSTKKGGIAGLFAGIAGVTIGLGIIDGLLKNIKAPALAAGGLAYGPTMALVGDNPNSSTDPEVISPLSKLRQYMGTGGGQQVHVEARIAGDDILLTSSRAQYRGLRRGSGNVISFNQ